MTYTIHIDTAFKSLESIARGDDSVIQVWGHDPEGKGLVYYIEGWGDNKMRVETFTEKLIDIILRYRKEDKRIFKITDEQETGGKIGTWEAVLRNACHDKKIPLPGGKLCVMKRGNKAKTRRILEAAAFWVEGHVKLVKGAPGVKKLISQMLRIGYSKHDDYADAASDVFAPEIYKTMRLHNRNTEEGVVPLRPGDELLRNGLMPQNTTELRSMYDAAARLDREQYSISTDNWPFS
jgi:phage terminase large subunit-like protein